MPCLCPVAAASCPLVVGDSGGAVSITDNVGGDFRFWFGWGDRRLTDCGACVPIPCPTERIRTLRDRQVVVKLGDFATARALDPSNPVASTAGNRLTLAPEVEDFGCVALRLGEGGGALCDRDCLRVCVCVPLRPLHVVTQPPFFWLVVAVMVGTGPMRTFSPGPSPCAGLLCRCRGSFFRSLSLSLLLLLLVAYCCCCCCCSCCSCCSCCFPFMVPPCFAFYLGSRGIP